jgi:hypothetical protein
MSVDESYEEFIHNNVTTKPYDLGNLELEDMYGKKIVGKNISNMTLNDLKKKINNKRIFTIRSLSKYIISSRFPYDNPHIIFNKEWKSWGDFFINETFKYDEAKQFIKDNINLSQIKTVKDWFNFSNDITQKEIKCIGDPPIYINEFIKIPNTPKEFYKDAWIGWNDFLGIELEQTKKYDGENKSIYDNNVDKNIKNILNNDGKKIKKKINWHTIKNIFCLVQTKKYIENIFDVLVFFVIKIKYKKSGKFEDVKIDFINHHNNKLIGLIYPKDRLINYDSDIKNKYNFDRKDVPDLRNERIIDNDKVIDELKQLLSDVKNNTFDNLQNNIDDFAPLKHFTIDVIKPGKKMREHFYFWCEINANQYLSSHSFYKFAFNNDKTGIEILDNNKKVAIVKQKYIDKLLILKERISESFYIKYLQNNKFKIIYHILKNKNINVPVVGMHWKDGYKFSPTDIITFEFEPNNKYDKTAIKVLANKKHVAYVTKDCATTLKKNVFSVNVDPPKGVIYEQSKIPAIVRVSYDEYM